MIIDYVSEILIILLLF